MPAEVLEKAQQELVDWRGHGMSLMEMSHRSDEFLSVRAEAEQDLRDLMGISDDYHVLFLQGGASTQFASVPLNLLDDSQCAYYLNSGQWSKKAIAEARRFGRVQVLAETRACAPEASSWSLGDVNDAAYVHYTPNETIDGVEYDYVPQTGDVPLVADFSSSILSHPIDVSRYGLIYAGAQKNIGPAGLCVVIVRKDLLERCSDKVPAMLNYSIHAKNDSLYNTPPTFSIYLAGLVFKWLKEKGGVEAMAKVNADKAARLYAAIDNSDFYTSPVHVAHRSRMNVPFILPSPELDASFLQGAEQAGLMNLAGHRSVGGMRASIYNAVSPASVDALIDFMQQFAHQHGEG